MSIRKAVMDAERKALEVRESILSGDSLDFEEGHRREPFKNRKPLFHCLTLTELATNGGLSLAGSVAQFAQTLDGKSPPTSSELVPDSQRVNPLEMTADANEILAFLRIEVLPPFVVSSARNVTSRLLERLAAALLCGGDELEQGRWTRVVSDSARQAYAANQGTSWDVATHVLSSVYPKPAIIACTSSIIVGIAEVIYKQRVRAEVRRKATRALQDSEGSIEGTVARSDLLWLEKTAKADDFPRAATKVILCSAFTSAGTVFVGSLGTYIWPGIGTDVGDVLGSLAGSLL